MVAHGGPQGPRFGSGILQSPRASILKSSSALDMAAVSWIVAPTSENMCGIRLVISLEADETSPLAQQEEPSSHGYDIRRIRRSPTKNKLFKHFLGDAGIQKKSRLGFIITSKDGNRQNTNQREVMTMCCPEVLS